MATIAENIQTLKSIKSDIKNAIIQKGGSVTDAFGTYAQAITNLPGGGGGGTEIEDALITRTLSGAYSNDRVSVVGSYAFFNCSNLTHVSLQNCLSVSINAFGGCTSLLYINLPNCSYLGDGVLSNCNNLIVVKIPLCTVLDYGCIRDCSKLTQVYLNSVTSVTNMMYDNIFNNCPNLTSIYVPSSLVDAFKVAPKWSSLSDKIVAYTGA